MSVVRLTDRAPVNPVGSFSPTFDTRVQREWALRNQHQAGATARSSVMSTAAAAQSSTVVDLLTLWSG